MKIIVKEGDIHITEVEDINSLSLITDRDIVVHSIVSNSIAQLRAYLLHMFDEVTLWGDVDEEMGDHSKRMQEVDGLCQRNKGRNIVSAINLLYALYSNDRGCVITNNPEKFAKDFKQITGKTLKLEPVSDKRIFVPSIEKSKE